MASVMYYWYTGVMAHNRYTWESCHAIGAEWVRSHHRYMYLCEMWVMSHIRCMCMYVYVYIYINICIYMYMYVCIYISHTIGTRVRHVTQYVQSESCHTINTCIYVRCESCSQVMHVYVCICICVSQYMYLHVYVCIYVPHAIDTRVSHVTQ